MLVSLSANTAKTDLSTYNNSWYYPKASFFKRGCWYFINNIFFRNSFNPFNGTKVFWLRVFGARVGKGVVLKPCINIKYPWLLQVGNSVWIGENVWIDNLTKVTIGDNVVVSQGAMLLTGSHDYTKSAFDLIIAEIVLEEGVWIGAKSIVCPGIICHSHSVLSAGSIATKHLDAYWIYQGNPAEKKRQRNINS